MQTLANLTVGFITASIICIARRVVFFLPAHDPGMLGAKQPRSLSPMQSRTQPQKNWRTSKATPCGKASLALSYMRGIGMMMVSLLTPWHPLGIAYFGVVIPRALVLAARDENASVGSSINIGVSIGPCYYGHRARR
jgi:hypothetical protein